MDFNVKNAAQLLQCNHTCLNYISDPWHPGVRSGCRIFLGNKCGPNKKCDYHSLKGYTGEMGKISNAMAYADKYNDAHKPREKEDKKDK
jgi:hypothetical protein